RRAPGVEVEDAAIRAVDPSALADVDELRSVLLQVDAMDPHVAEPATAAQRHVVLRDLVALRQVRVEVVLAVEQRALGDLAAERQPDHQPVVDRTLVDHRQGPRQAEADRAGVDVGLISERELATAEHLRARSQLDVDLQPDHRLVCHTAHPPPPRRAGLPSKPIACSSANATSSMRLSLNAGPASWKPTGSPSLHPEGMEIAGMPANGIGTVQKSLRYMASGSSVLAPSSNAVHGLVGVTTKSSCSNAAAKSSEIFVLTFWAVP